MHALVSGLQRTRALRTLWDELPRRDHSTMQSFEALTTSADRYATLRAVHSQHTPPKLPYLELTLSDLVAIEARFPEDRSGAQINFLKRRLIYDVISNLLQAQQEPYHFMVCCCFLLFCVFVPCTLKRWVAFLIDVCLYVS